MASYTLSVVVFSLPFASETLDFFFTSFSLPRSRTVGFFVHDLNRDLFGCFFFSFNFYRSVGWNL